MGAHRSATATLVAVLLAGFAATLTSSDTVAAQEESQDPVEPVAGGDRFATDGALADRVDGTTSWVATGFDFADALTAGATATGPVLLVAGDSALPSTLDAARGLTGIELNPTIEFQ